MSGRCSPRDLSVVVPVIVPKHSVPVGSFVTEVLKPNEGDKPVGRMHHAVHLGERARSILPNMSSSGEALKQSG